METPKYCEVTEQTFNATTEFKAEAGKRFVGDIGGDGVLEYWDGVAYVAYDDSGPGFTFYAPATGKLRLTVNVAPVIFSMTRAREMD